jgi:signal transduction histidine kinase
VLHTINGEADRMIRLVGSLLTLARADAGQVPITKETVDLGQIVTDAVGQMGPAASVKGIDLEIRPGPVIRFFADEGLLLQMMLNLLDNAVKYTPNHGLVGVTWALEDGQAVVRVSDTGAGISAAHLDRIFDRFYRVDKARGHPTGGAGLGLSISRWIAEAHRGTIAADSTPGEGATFTVRFPTSE